MDERKKILIVDDDQDFVEATKIVLESNSYSVCSASGPNECFEILSEEKPDLILLDVMWPDKVSGFEVCRRLKKDIQFRKIPVIMLTAVDRVHGLGFKNVAGDEVWLPCDDFISKPADPQEMLKKISKYLGCSTVSDTMKITDDITKEKK